MFSVVRSQPAPASLATEKLKTSGEYNKPDVLVRLKEDFYNKCYLCEEKAISKIEVDHFLPHLNGTYLDRKFDWDNLFFCCGHCNGTKGSNQDTLLDCTSANDDIYNNLRYDFVSFPKEAVNISATNTNNKSDNTAKLLNQIYSGKDPTNLTNRVMEAGNIREKIRQEIDKFTDLLLAPRNNNIVNQIKNALSKKSPFSAFKRQIVKNNNDQSLIALFD